jgi:hypothetical protein
MSSSSSLSASSLFSRGSGDVSDAERVRVRFGREEEA